MEQFCEEQKLDAGAGFELNLVLEELFVNALRHGGCEGLEDAVRIRLREEGGAVQVEFSDRGAAFDPTGEPAPELATPLEQRAPGGLGIHLVRQLAQDFSYRRESGWNMVTLRRKAPGTEDRT